MAAEAAAAGAVAAEVSGATADKTRPGREHRETPLAYRAADAIPRHEMNEQGLIERTAHRMKLPTLQREPGLVAVAGALVFAAGWACLPALNAAGQQDKGAPPTQPDKAKTGTQAGAPSGGQTDSGQQRKDRRNRKNRANAATGG